MRTLSQKISIKSRVQIAYKYSWRKKSVCEECGKLFYHKQNLDRHVLFHKELKPFSCIECEQQFTTKKHLAEHREKHELKKYECKKCSKHFSTKSENSQHEKTHEKTKDHKCSLCAKSIFHEIQTFASCCGSQWLKAS